MADVDVKQVQSVTDRPLVLFLNGQPTPVSKLRPADWAAAGEYVKQKRTEAFLRTMKINPAMYETNVAVLARIQCESVMRGDVIDDWHGRVKMCQLAIARAGKHMPEDLIANQLETDDNFFEVLQELSGLRKQIVENVPVDPT